jgi:hypothetical protein
MITGSSTGLRLTDKPVQSQPTPPTPTDANKEESNAAFERANTKHKKELMWECPQKETLELRYSYSRHVSTKNSGLRFADKADPTAEHEKGGDENQEVFPA